MLSDIGEVPEYAVATWWRWFGWATAGCATVIGLILFKVYRLRRKVTSSPAMLECVNKYRKDYVYLWLFPRPKKALPDISPFGLKVETYLRIADIPYKTHHIQFNERSTKGQIPFVYINGKQFSDSTCMVREIGRHFKVKLEYDLTAEQRGASQAFCQMMDQATVWTYFWYRYVISREKFWNSLALPFGKLVLMFVCKATARGMRKRATQQGTGRLSEAEMWQIAYEDLQAISNYLGDKPYMMGSAASKVDAVLFGHLAQLVYIDIAYPHKTFVQQDFPNILAYVERIKTNFWPDWDEIINSPTG